MGKYIMVVQSKAKEGRDDEYNAWYDNTHIHEICALPGVKSGKRYDATPIAFGAPGLPYLSVYEIEADDPGVLFAEMGRRSQAGEMTHTDSLDAPSSVLWVYKER